MKHIVIAALTVSLGLGGMHAANQKYATAQALAQQKQQAIVNQNKQRLNLQQQQIRQLQFQHTELCKQFKVKPKGC